jgi:ketosteroid isomerase-like protein
MRSTIFSAVSDSVDVVLRAFRAVEQRDPDALYALYHPEVEFHEAPSLPYGGAFRGEDVERDRQGGEGTWSGTWNPVQPTAAERAMDPRVVAAEGDEVVVLYRQRAVDRAGRRFDRPVLGLYEVRDGKLARAQMFHFDTAAILEFLSAAACAEARTAGGTSCPRSG